MMPLKESLAATGFDPAWLEQVVAKFGEDLLPLLEALVAAGFAPAWLATYVEMLGPIFLKLAVAWIAKTPDVRRRTGRGRRQAPPGGVPPRGRGYPGGILSVTGLDLVSPTHQGDPRWPKTLSTSRRPWPA
jgi:hypothetical protein